MVNLILCESSIEYKCPFCKHKDNYSDSESINKSKKGYLIKKCNKCKIKIGITANIKGDIVAFKINNKKEK